MVNTVLFHLYKTLGSVNKFVMTKYRSAVAGEAGRLLRGLKKPLGAVDTFTTLIIDMVLWVIYVSKL